MINPLYALSGIVGIMLYVAWVLAFGTRAALWWCLFLLPFRVVLPPSVGGLVGFENMFLVPDLLIPLTFAVWCLKRLAVQEASQGLRRQQLIPSVLVWVYVAFLLSYRPEIDGRGFLSELQKWSVYLFAFVLVSQHCKDSSDLTKTVNSLLIGGAFATVRDVMAYSSLFNLPGPLGYSPNRDAFLFSAFDLQRYQGTGWPFFINTLLLFVFARLAVRGVGLTTVQRWALWAYGGILAGLLALSFYRGDWIALAGALVASLTLPRAVSPRVVRTIVPLLLMGILLVALAGSGVLAVGLQERFQTLLRPGSEEHLLVRLDAMAEGWRMFRDHPLTGIGLGQFGNNFELYASAQVFGLAIDPSFYQQANNDYVQYLGTTGLIGILALGALFWGFLRRSYQLIVTTATPETRAVLVACFLAIVAFLVTAVSQDPTWDKTYGTLLFTVFGLVWAVQRQAA